MMLPTGRARLLTRSSRTGSPPLMKIMGIVPVALFAASADGLPTAAIIRLTPEPASSAANPGNRSYLPSAQRYSIATFCPSTYPVLLQAIMECRDK